MHIQHLIFQPTLSGYYLTGRKMPLDQGTPRGLFMTMENSRYIVCDDPVRRFAVALQHPQLAPFTMFNLGGLPADTGTCEGEGVIHLGERQEWNQTDRDLGTLEIEDGLVRMLVQTLSGRTYWEVIAHGSGGATGMYEEWAFMIDHDMPFFGDGW